MLAYLARWKKIARITLIGQCAGGWRKCSYWVVVVSRRLAAELWPEEDPLGKMLSFPAGGGDRRLSMRAT